MIIEEFEKLIGLGVPEDTTLKKIHKQIRGGLESDQDDISTNLIRRIKPNWWNAWKEKDDTIKPKHYLRQP